jgi:ATP phosphoribosyltransferase
MTSRRMTLAVPNKGRLVEPTLALLHDAGLVFEERDRSLVSRVENVEIDILFVRTNDVVEFVRDAVADLGITGGDLLAESEVDLPVVRSLGYGRCRLAAAVPSDSAVRAITDLAGQRVATSHPRATRAWFAGRSIEVEVISLSGAVEVAPRLGLAEAIVDLVSTGATLATNGLRPIGDLLASEAILVGNPIALRERADDVDRLVTMIGAVLEGRRRKYVMMNAPATRLAELESLLPGLESPSVIPLAHAGMIAIHAVVGSDDVWGLLPRLKAAGASGILVLPIEKLVP